MTFSWLLIHSFYIFRLLYRQNKFTKHVKAEKTFLFTVLDISHNILYDFIKVHKCEENTSVFISKEMGI